MKKPIIDFLFRMLLLIAVETYFVVELIGYKLSDFTSNSVEHWRSKAFVVIVVVVCPYAIYIEVQNFLKGKTPYDRT